MKHLDPTGNMSQCPYTSANSNDSAEDNADFSVYKEYLTQKNIDTLVRLKEEKGYIPESNYLEKEKSFLFRLVSKIYFKTSFAKEGKHQEKYEALRAFEKLKKDLLNNPEKFDLKRTSINTDDKGFTRVTL